MDPRSQPLRDPATMLAQVLREWGGERDLWLFGYASLIWRPDFEPAEQRLGRVHGYHRALKMWSRVNRGTPECPGLVFALLRGGSCHGMAFRVPKAQGEDVLRRLWPREMVTGVYDPRWLNCQTAHGSVPTLAFTLPRDSPNYTGELDADQYRQIFASAHGRFGSTLDYARLTLEHLERLGIHDAALARLLRLA
jgi:glutathione-specific gamma-glutamylcyclotransferase